MDVEPQRGPAEDLVHRCRAVLEEAWREDPGFCVPNGMVYPHQWLWDSCFHSLAWTALGDRRGVVELRSALANQDQSSGFIPHMSYWDDPAVHADFWGRPDLSTITQPPMFGHAVAMAIRAGFAVEDDLTQRAISGIAHLLIDRPKIAGLVCVLHPWETGCDDSARWDDWCPGGFEPEQWRRTKADLVAALHFEPSVGYPIGSSAFQVPSVGFNALLAWNSFELLSVGAGEPHRARADELVAAIADRWDQSLRTWTDADSGSGVVRTLDGLLPLLVDPRDEAFDDLLDPATYGAAFGPCGVHRDEPSYDPEQYWRGPSWPQLTYLLAVAGRRAGRHDVADTLMASLRSAARNNGFAEYWHPDTGAPGGANPQTWTTLAAVPV
ncbi:MAG: hypothetical protein HKN03_03070 [Acidimicrobiales bacterium]|nr:hypothetical protein [Acidimicrobiales bacterium]